MYTRFGGRTGALDALYERIFELLRDELARLPPASGDVARDVLAFAHVYRGFALASPARYAFMFERAVPGYNPCRFSRLTSFSHHRLHLDFICEVRLRQRTGPVAQRPHMPMTSLRTTETHIRPGHMRTSE